MQTGTWGALLVIALCGPSSAFAQARPLSCDELWQHALDHAPALARVHGQRAQIEAARAHARGVLADNPTLTLEGGPRFQGTGRSYDLTVGVSQPVRVAGQRAREQALASTSGERVRADMALAEWEQQSALFSACRAALLAREESVLATSAVAFEERVLALVQKQVKAGETTPLKLGMAEIAVLEARRASLAAEQALLEARIELAQLSGFPSTAPPDVAGHFLRVQLPALDALLAEARKRTPELRVLEKRVAEARAQREVSERKGAPSPELGLAYVREGSTPAAGPISHSALLTLSVPVALRSANPGEQADARAAETLATATHASARQLFEGEVARWHGRVQASERQVELYTSSLLPRFEEQLEKLERALTLGEVDLFELTTLRASLLRAQHTALDVRAAYLQALSGLERLLGYQLQTQASDGALP
jgi:cobalt-zinc-cadmium efflux system outer membrane protein